MKSKTWITRKVTIKVKWESNGNKNESKINIKRIDMKVK